MTDPLTPGGHPMTADADTPDTDPAALGAAAVEEPVTEAGRRAQYELCHFDRCAGMKGPNDCDCGVVRAILAIEAEALSRQPEPQAPVDVELFVDGETVVGAAAYTEAGALALIMGAEPREPQPRPEAARVPQPAPQEPQEPTPVPDAAALVADIRRLHQPIPEGTGGTGDAPQTQWNGPCRADMQVWPCYAEQAAAFIERPAIRAEAPAAVPQPEATPPVGVDALTLEAGDGPWLSMWDDLRHNATGNPSGWAIVARHRPLIEHAIADRTADRVLRAVAEAEALRAAIRAEAPAPSMPPAVGLPLDVLAREPSAAALAWSALLKELTGKPMLRVVARIPEIGAAYQLDHSRAVAPVGDGLREAAEAYIEAVTSYLEPDNQYTESRRRHYQRTEDALAAALAATEDPDHAAGGDIGSEYGRLLAERDRLIADGVDPADLELPLPPPEPQP